MIFPVGVGLMSSSPTGVLGLTITTGAASCPLSDSVFGKKLTAFVVADHVFDSHGGLFVCRLAIRVQSEASDSAGVDYTVDAFIEGSLHNVVRAFDVALIHLVRVFAPQPIVGCAVIDDATTFGRQPERIQISKVSGDELH